MVAEWQANNKKLDPQGPSTKDPSHPGPKMGLHPFRITNSTSLPRSHQVLRFFSSCIPKGSFWRTHMSAGNSAGNSWGWGGPVFHYPFSKGHQQFFSQKMGESISS